MQGELEKLAGPKPAAQKIAGGFGSVAGPVFSRIGYLLFCDTQANRMMKWNAGTISVFRENSSGARALTFDHQGRLLACERGQVTRTEKDGKITDLAGQLQAPADLVYAIDASIYFSDGKGIHQITRNGEVRMVAHDCERTGGVALAPNQQKLYAVDSAGAKIWMYEIATDGGLRGGRVFAAVNARGLKSDEMGNVWAASERAIVILDVQGRRLGEIPMPEDPNNCTWGDGFRNLYITAGASVYKIETKVNGTRTY
jgi:sugar lactone lactonase YvrE